MRLSCCAYSYRDYLKNGAMTLEEFVDTASDIGFEGVELTAYYFPTTEREYLNRIKRHVHRRGLSVSGTAIGTDFAQADAEKRRSHVQMAREWIDHSVALGAPTIRVFAGPVHEGSTEEQAFGWVVEALQECAAYAGARGVLLALENHGGITGEAGQALRIMSAVDSQWLGLNLDFGNFTGDIYEQFALCAPHAVATHAKVTYRSESGPEPVDYARVKSIMEAAGYRGWLAVEYEEQQDPKEAVPAFAKQLQAVFGR